MLFMPVLMTVIPLFLLGLPCIVSFPIVYRRQSPPIEVPWLEDTNASSGQYTPTEVDFFTVALSTLSAAVVAQVPETSLQVAQATSSPTLTDETTNDLTPVLLPVPSFDLPAGPLITSISTSTAQSASESLSVSITTFVTTLAVITTATYFEPPFTITVGEPAATVTDVITVTATPTALWSAPTHFTNLDSFAITNFACGQNNLQIADGIPANASATALALQAANTAVPRPIPVWNNASSVMQLFYPAGSYNPSNKPLGGADFYAAPVDMTNATNVTLEYSVFFPADFDWVQGGKLPGLYGGHTECSGGDNATTCFSTRMMWRKDGAGELYLYAPKDKQTAALCSAPPESVCDAAYGLSVGRGSFYFAPGAWTNIKQTVVLNTPGVQNGGFLLLVNGQQIMNRTDVFYRDITPSSPSKPSTSSTAAVPPATTSGGLLSPILGPIGPILGSLPGSLPGQILQPLVGRQVEEVDNRRDLLPLPLSFSFISNAIPATLSILSSTSDIIPTASFSGDISIGPLYLADATAVTTQTLSTIIAPLQTLGPVSLEATDQTKPIGFSGIFFSTFFGGSTTDYATPKDQYTWFKDFSVTVNS